MSYLRIPKEELTNEAYHNRPRSLSSSGIKDCAKSVDLYYFNKANRKESKAMDTGSYFHTWVLEPESYKPMVLPKISMASKGGDPKKAAGVIDLLMFIDNHEYSKDCDSPSVEDYKKIKMDDLKGMVEMALKVLKKEGFDLIDQETFEKVEAMKAGIKAHELNEGGRILALDNANIEIESSYFIPVQALEGFESVEMELELRIRPDYLMHGKYIADLKSTKTSDPKKFKYEVLKYGYHVSAAFYLDCYNAYMKWLHREKIEKLEGDLKVRVDNPYTDSIEQSYTVIKFESRISDFIESILIHEFKLVACENTGTGICTIFDLSPELLEAGRKIYKEGLWNYINYQDGFVYGGYSSEIVTLNI